MSTFGPVYVGSASCSYVSVSRKIPLSYEANSGRLPAYFYGVHTDDDEKPVVHAKYSMHGGPPLVLGDTYLCFERAELVPGSGGDAVVSWVSEYGAALYLAVTLDYSQNPSYGYYPFFRWIWFHLATYDGKPVVRWNSGDIDMCLRHDGGIEVLRSSIPEFARFRPFILEFLVENKDEFHLGKRYQHHWVEFRTIKSLASGILDIFRNHCLRLPLRTYSYSWGQPLYLPIAELPNPRGALALGEDNIPDYGDPIGPVGTSKPECVYALNAARTRAFVSACESMPRLSDNSISNISEILEFILSIVRREPPKVPAKLNEVWLGYRYQYSTTKMDLAEAWDFVNRCYDLGSMFAPVRCHGLDRFEFGGRRVTLRCSFDASPTERHVLQDFGALWRLASQLGLAPDLYYLWDSTPFSFMVDWFVPVGDVLAAIDAGNLYTRQNYSFSPIVYSLEYSTELEGMPVRAYSRWIEEGTPAICPLYWMENKSPSKRQVAYRALDTASLIIGGAFG